MTKLYSRKLNFTTLLLWLALNLWAQIPEGYYEPAAHAKERELKTVMATIIGNHAEITYKELWSAFLTTDRTPEGTVWDMYSAVTHYTFIEDQCGNYKKEGDCYNREHAVPKSWFHDEYPMYTDLFHIYPTDGYVNGRRSDYPYGETEFPSYCSDECFSKLGPCSFPGYEGVVFEPADEYKGDFARSYWYMATCYENQVSNWESPMFAGNSYPAFDTWAVELLLKWCRMDPVSQKETDRNEAVYGFQNNRNPFIDFPGLEEYIWGNCTDEAFDPDGYMGIGGILSVFRVTSSSGTIVIHAERSTQIQIFDLLGRCVKNIQVEPGETYIPLPSGIYIVNGQKVGI